MLESLALIFFPKRRSLRRKTDWDRASIYDNITMVCGKIKLPDDQPYVQQWFYKFRLAEVLFKRNVLTTPHHYSELFDCLLWKTSFEM